MRLNIEEVIAGHGFLQQAGLSGLRALLNMGGRYDLTTLTVSAIEFRDAFRLWFWDRMIFCRILPEGTLMGVMTVFADELDTLGQQYEHELENETDLTPQLVAIADRRFVMIAGHDDYYDTQIANWAATIPPTFEGVSYNMARMVQIEWERITEMRNERQEGSS